MSMKLSEKSVGIWFVQVNKKQDWMLHLEEVTPNQEYRIVYRHRYYNDDKAFDSEDRKSWYSLEAKGTRAETIERIREVVEMTKTKIAAEGPYWEFINDHGFEDFRERFMAAPFVHKQEVPVGQA